jgi:hypothetical protein
MGIWIGDMLKEEFGDLGYGILDWGYTEGSDPLN